MTPFATFLRIARPTLWASLLTLCAIGLLGLAAVLTVVAASDGTEVGLILFFFGGHGAVLALLVAAAGAGRALPRAVLFASASLLLGLSGQLLFTLVGLDTQSDTNLGEAFLIGGVFYYPLAALLLTPALWFGSRVPAEYRRQRRDDLIGWLADRLRDRGEIKLADMADACGITEEAAGDLLHELIEGDHLEGQLDRRRGQFWTQDRLNEAREHIVGAVMTRGEVTKQELADELHLD